MRIFDFPFAAYNGGPLAAKTYRRGGLPLLTVQALVKWATYSVAGAPLGDSNPEFSVVTDISAASNQAPAAWQIMSVYVDNEAVNFPVYVRFPDSQYTISCPPNSSGWFPAYTGARSCLISALGITDSDIADLATTAVYFTDDIKVPYLDPEQQTAVEMALASPTISFGGTGRTIQSIAIAGSGSGYASGALAITGGGGIGASASGTVDQFGRFTSVAITAAGSGFTSSPLVTPTGGQSSPAAWNAATVYSLGNLVVYNGIIYQALGANVGRTPPAYPSIWLSSGTAPSVPAAFNVTLTNPVSGLTTVSRSNYAPRALGDQCVNYFDTVTSSGQFRQNLWGSPSNSGYIYLTSVFIGLVSSFPASGSSWQIDNDAGDPVLQLRTSASNPMILTLSNCNIRLPANQNWRLSCSSFGAAFSVNHAFTYTYSPI